MANYGKHFTTRVTPQTEKAKSNQEKNNAGGYVFVLDKWARLDRWLILGAEGGTYYVSEKKLTKNNAAVLLECLREDGIRTVNRIVEISDAGRAPKNDPAIFALAMAAGDENLQTRKAALAALPKVCRIGTHLFHFARDVEHFRKWGRGLRTAVAAWYTEKPVERLGYDVVKYQQRDGWSHRDLLRLSHPVARDAAQEAVFRYLAVGPEGFAAREVKRKLSNKGEKLSTYSSISTEKLPKIINGFERAKGEKDLKKLVKLIADYGLTREMIPTEALNYVEVWEALLEDMPLTALIRNLGKMTAVGLFKPLAGATKKAIGKLTDEVAIRKARVHPLAILVAQRIYRQGHGDKGSLKWAQSAAILDALNEAFYKAFGVIEPTKKNTLLALDVSGSMSSGSICGAPLTPRDGTAAMAMVTARTEAAGSWAVMGFSKRFIPLNISPSQRLDDVIQAISGLPFETTDCGLPMVWALENKIEVDTFVVYTDNETYAGHIHPFQALRNYREKMGRPSKLVVVGMTSTEFTIADPSDGGMLDVVGFDTAAPAVISDFARN